MMRFLTPRLEALATGGTFKEFKEYSFRHRNSTTPIEVQREIVINIEAHQRRIEELKNEIAEREQKIKLSIDRVWTG